jgi:tetratricopeptide (TPR) repeat protein
MYLRTPKQYRKQRRHLLSLRWLWLWILTPVVALVGIHIYQNQDTYGPPVRQVITDAFHQFQGSIATAVAPTALPTANPTDQLALANSSWQRGAIEDAVHNYQAILDAVPNDLTVHYRVAFGLLMDGRYADGLAAAEQAVSASPYSDDAWAIRTMALDRNGETGLAIASGLQALSLNPDSARALAFLGEAYLDAGDSDRALETVNRALEKDPNSFEAYYVRGRINQEKLFNFDAAHSDYETAMQLAPTFPYIGIHLAALDYRMEPPNYDEGITTLKSILDVNPNNVEALFWIAFLYYSGQGDPTQALEYLNRCVQSDAKNIPCLYYQGQVQYFTGQTDSAVESFQAVLDAGSQNPRYFLSAGRVYSEMGNCPKATPILQQGYQLLQAQESPDQDTLVGFQEALAACNVPGFNVTPEVTPQATADASSG